MERYSVGSIGTNFSGITPLNKVNPWVKGAEKAAVDQPNSIADYNTGMGEVALLDKKLASYRPKLTYKKMAVATFWQCIEYSHSCSI